MKNMCAGKNIFLLDLVFQMLKQKKKYLECGADLLKEDLPKDSKSTGKASVAVLHSIPELKVSSDVRKIQSHKLREAV